MVKATLFYTEIDDLIEYDGASMVCANAIASGWGRLLQSGARHYA